MRPIATLTLCLLFLTSITLAQPASQLTTPEDVLEANIEATGGRGAWDRITTSRISGTQSVSSSMGSFDLTWETVTKYPGYARTKSIPTMDASFASTTVVTPERSWFTSHTGEVKDFDTEYTLPFAGPLAEISILDNKDIRLVRLDTDDHEERPVYVVTIEVDGKALKRYYDQETHLLVAAQKPNMMNTSKDWVYYDDYREVEDVMIATSTFSKTKMQIVMESDDDTPQDQLMNAPREEMMEMKTTLDKIEWNVELDESLFQN